MSLLPLSLILPTLHVHSSLTERNTTLGMHRHAEPFRAPHSTTDARGVEVEFHLATHGTLFLDDAEEWKRETIATLVRVIECAPHGPARIVVTAGPFEHSREGAARYDRAREVWCAIRDACETRADGMAQRARHVRGVWPPRPEVPNLSDPTPTKRP